MPSTTSTNSFTTTVEILTSMITDSGVIVSSHFESSSSFLTENTVSSNIFNSTTSIYHIQKHTPHPLVLPMDTLQLHNSEHY